MMLTSGKGQLFSPLLKLSLRRQQKISATRSWSSCAHVSGGELYTANYQRRSSDNFDNPFQNLLPPCYIPPRLHPSHKEQLRLQQFRSFYSTKQREILPLVGAVTVFVVARYSWKAIQVCFNRFEFRLVNVIGYGYWATYNLAFHDGDGVSTDFTNEHLALNSCHFCSSFYSAWTKNGKNTSGSCNSMRKCWREITQTLARMPT